MNGGLNRFEEALHERSGIFVEDDGETHFHAVDVRLIVEHIGFDDRLSVAGIANTGQDVGDEFGIEGHVERTKGGISAFEVDSDSTFGHALRIFHHFEVFGVVGVARQGVEVVNCYRENTIIRGGRAENVNAIFERVEFGHHSHEGFEVLLHPSGVFEGCFSFGAVFEAPHDDMFEHEIAGYGDE